MHTLLAYAVRLQLVRKMHVKGSNCRGWSLGVGRIGATIESRKTPLPLPPDLAAKRRASRQRLREKQGDAAPEPFQAIRWPASTFIFGAAEVSPTMVLGAWPGQRRAFAMGRPPPQGPIPVQGRLTGPKASRRPESMPAGAAQRV